MIVTERVWNVRPQITGVSTSLGVSVASYAPRRGRAGVVSPREGAASPDPPESELEFSACPPLPCETGNFTYSPGVSFSVKHVIHTLCDLL